MPWPPGAGTSLRKHRRLFDASQQRCRQGSGRPESDTSTLNRVVAQLHFQTVVRQDSGGFVSPLDGNYSWSCEVIAESDGLRFLHRVETIEIDMCERKPSVVFVQEYERRTADILRGCAEPYGDATDKRRFAGSQGAGQGQ